MVNLYSRAAKTRYWQEYTRLMMTQENYMRGKLTPILSKQYKGISKIVGSGSKKVNGYIDSYNDDFKKVFIDAYTRIGVYFRHYAMSKIQDGEKKEISSFWTNLRTWIREWSANKVQKVQATTKKQINRIIDNGVMDGLSYGKMAEKIAILSKIASEFRAFRIARTETHSAINETVDDSMEVDGNMQEKEWLAAIDERTRDAHIDMNETRIAMDEDFEVDSNDGKDSMQFPGDATASPENLCNCRCVALYYS